MVVYHYTIYNIYGINPIISNNYNYFGIKYINSPRIIDSFNVNYFAFIKISDRIFHELSNDELNLRFVKVSSENISKGSIFYSSKTVKSRYQSSQQQ